MSKHRNETGGLPMFQPPPEPQAYARRTDPETSQDAAASVRVTEGQAEVLDFFMMWGPMPDHLMVSMAEGISTRQSPSGLRTRRAELVTKGLLVWAERWVRLPSGRRARVWRIPR